MAFRVPLLFKAVLFALCIFGCNNPEDFVVTKSDESLHSNNGVLFYHNVPLNGRVYTLHKETYDTANVTPYKKGKKHGVALSFYSNRNKKSERYYENGSNEGTYTKWWPNGELKRIAQFKNDVFEGEIKEWNKEGRLVLHMHYKNGHEYGSQKVWYDNGKIKSNYVIKNNRRYGLLGTKNCVNVADSLDY